MRECNAFKSQECINNGGWSTQRASEDSNETSDQTTTEIDDAFEQPRGQGCWIGELGDRESGQAGSSIEKGFCGGGVFCYEVVKHRQSARKHTNRFRPLDSRIHPTSTWIRHNRSQSPNRFTNVSFVYIINLLKASSLFPF